MEVVAANKLAHDVARYIRDHPRPVELSRRVLHITHGQGLDENDREQITRKVRWILFGEPRQRRANRMSK